MLKTSSISGVSTSADRVPPVVAISTPMNGIAITDGMWNTSGVDTRSHEIQKRHASPQAAAGTSAASTICQ